MKEKLADFGLLWLRVLAGLGLLIHGWLKLTGPVDAFSRNMVEVVGFPVPLLFAWLVVATEILGGFFLVLGLWTRWVALPILIVMGVAAFNPTAPAAFISASGPSKEPALAYFAIAATVLMMGAGQFSVDASRGGAGSVGGKKSKR